MLEKIGLFVSFEGGEGAGKTTQIKLLRTALEAAGHTVCITREPGGDAVAEAVRSLLLHTEMTPRAELLLFLASRAQNTERVIRPSLERGEVVLCDRFIDSSVAYQGCARGLGRDAVAGLNEFATGNLKPKLTVLLDIDPSVGVTRQMDKNRMETEDRSFHEAVRQGFLIEAENDSTRFLVIPADRPADEIHAKILERTLALLTSAR